MKMPKIITLDAGHHGKANRSPVVPEYYESEMTWKLHLLLKNELEKRGFTVRTTRADQTKNLEVTKRGKLAKGSDMFISLHSDAISSAPEVNRVTVFRAYDDLNNASVLALAFGKAVSEVMGVNVYKQATRRLSTGVGEYYGVMRGARSVGCPLYFLIEHSFHTNEYAARFLLDENNLKKIAVAEAEVIAAYYAGDLEVADESFRIKGFAPLTTVGTALQSLKKSGYDAVIYKDERDYICTGDAIYIGNDIYAAVVTGDVNGDGKSDAADYTLIKRYILGKAKLSGAYLDAADINGDGNVDALDYIYLKRLLTSK